ncbi:hypothetical protein [Arthrobacter caoxuetaonis]|uniref:Uncharacterized protein n=1 Tax=Arthrobacter caoxuetaonis TaxID=2886935 RepID=A0A9X1SGU8_9MICC|nr:hypothetical protein [Arthrobacter caoxuetaonis]MCC3299744.1 hypothetical protein [Arthrobacter caoxuetaonis]USQ59354.1 hypothetical protein NF551_17380 [Arthrobacter caoxuetaonis]
MQNTWNFRLRGSIEISWTETPLFLKWILPGTHTISDNYVPEEMSAKEALAAWINTIGPMETVPIGWVVSGPGLFEDAPFCPEDPEDPRSENFLSFYTWPVHAETGEPLNFLHLPVHDELWEIGKERGKSGFVQAALGWKPSPLQQTMDLKVLFMNAGLGTRVR